MRARDYQTAGVDSVFREWESVTSTLGVAATGLGKTVMFAMAIQRRLRNAFPRQPKAMVLANGKELIYQAADKIQKVTGLQCEIEMGDLRAHGSSLMGGNTRVIVSTIQTQCDGGDGGGRMGKFDPMDFDVLIVDEADGATSASFRRAIDYYKTNPRLKILGVTATPDRTDEESLGQIFESVAFDLELNWAIENGWLVEPHQRMVNVEGLDFSGVKTSKGDLNGAELESVMTAEKPVQQMTQSIFEYMFGFPEGYLRTIDVEQWKFKIEGLKAKRTLAFAASVKHAETLANIFNRIAPGLAHWVCGKTDPDDRKRINDNYHAGNFPLLCNFGTHAVGFDSPAIEIIANGRPTKSRRLYAQIAGRSTRTLPGVIDGLETKEERLTAIKNSAKPSALILDFVGNSGKHKLVCMADILGGKCTDIAVERAIANVRKSGRPISMTEALAEEQAKLDAEIEEKRLAEEARKLQLVAKTDYSSKKVDAFDFLDVQPVKEQSWNIGKGPTEKQVEFLAKNGIDSAALSKTQAGAIIGKIMERRNNNLCTVRQAKILKKHNLDPNMTFDDARIALDGIFKRREVEQPF